MNIFIRRPVMTTLLMLAVVVFGIMGYRRLPVSDLPSVEFPTITVGASYPGASPETMAASIATPLEKQFSTIAGVNSMTSTSTLGSTQIVLQFVLERDIDAAATDVQSAISVAMGNLPRDIPAPPSYQKVNPADTPIVFIRLVSDSLPLYTLDTYGETIMAQRISMLSGVSQVLVYGSQKYAPHVQVDPRALAAKGIGIDEVVSAVQTGNVNMPVGTLWGSAKAFDLKVNGQMEEAAAYNSLVVAYRNGAPVRVRDIGRAVDSVQNERLAAWVGDARSITLAVMKQPGTNTVEIAKSIRDLLPAFREMLPASVNMDVMYDRSVPIRESVRDVKMTLLVTLVLVVLVIFLFLRNLSATIIPSLALPLALVGTFAVMYLLGYSLDNLSLMALTLAVGFVVDDAVVMLENIVRHLEMGKKPYDAALDGAREVGFTIVSMTLSLVAVFIPLLFMGGIIGRLFTEFGVTIAIAILVSGAVSLSLTPMMCSRFLRSEHDRKHGKLYDATERGWLGILKAYERSLAWVMRHRLAALAFSAAILGGTVFLADRVPKGFLPSPDNGFIFGVVEGQQGISFDDMVAHQKAVAAVLAGEPAVETYMRSVSSGSAGMMSNQGRVFARLVSREKRHLTPEQVIEKLRPKLYQIPGIRVYLQNPPPFRIGGKFTAGLYMLSLQSLDLDTLFRSAKVLEDRLRAVDQITDLNTDLLIESPEVNVDIQRDRAYSLGITASQIEQALYSSYAARQVSTILGDLDQYKVIVEMMPEYQTDPAAVSLLYLKSRNGDLVPLDAVAKITPGTGPLAINHTGQLPSVTLSFNLKPGVSLGEAVTAVNRVARDTLPATVTASFGGTAQAFQSSFGSLGLLLVIAILAIYMILGILYESFIHPLTILSGLPFAGFGALLTLIVFRSELNVYSFVGLIMLIGVVKKNAIMMIDFALAAQRNEGKSAEASILEACSIRFRPIMMTTMAAFMGTLPIALGLGAGAEARRPLGLAVVGGLFFSQLITLYVTPVFYTYLDSFQHWLGRRFSRAHGERGESPETV